MLVGCGCCGAGFCVLGGVGVVVGGFFLVEFSGIHPRKRQRQLRNKLTDKDRQSWLKSKVISIQKRMTDFVGHSSFPPLTERLAIVPYGQG